MRGSGRSCLERGKDRRKGRRKGAVSDIVWGEDRKVKREERRKRRAEKKGAVRDIMWGEDGSSVASVSKATSTASEPPLGKIGEADFFFLIERVWRWRKCRWGDEQS